MLQYYWADLTHVGDGLLPWWIGPTSRGVFRREPPQLDYVVEGFLNAVIDVDRWLADSTRVDDVVISLGSRQTHHGEGYMGILDHTAMYTVIVPEDLLPVDSASQMARWLTKAGLDALAEIGLKARLGEPPWRSSGCTTNSPQVEHVEGRISRMYDKIPTLEALLIAAPKLAPIQVTEMVSKTAARGVAIADLSAWLMKNEEWSPSRRWSQFQAPYNFTDIDIPIFVDDLFEAHPNQLLACVPADRSLSARKALQRVANAAARLRTAGFVPRVAGRDRDVLWCTFTLQ